VGKHAKTLRLLDVATTVLAEHNPMTVRQVYYQLVSRHVIENSRTAYQSVSNALVDARKDGRIDWSWIEDRNRRPRRVPMWGDLAAICDSVLQSYRRDVWASQPAYLEVWLEKDALSGIFEEVLEPYGVTLNVGRGYDGWSSIHAAAQRYQKWQDVTVLYFGDFDPSGEDMVRSLKDRLAFFDCHPAIIKCALTKDDIDAYNLPPDFTKAKDSRRTAFVAQHGDLSVELDAMPVPALRDRLVEQVHAHMDVHLLYAVRELEDQERDDLAALLAPGA
jgi:hypothetical protein